MFPRDFPLKAGSLGDSGGTVHDYRTPLVGFKVKTDKTDDSHYSKAIHQEIQKECKTKTTHDERLEKRVCEIELRGSHLNLVFYNGNL